MHPRNPRWTVRRRTSLLRTCVEVFTVLTVTTSLVALAWFGLGTREFRWVEVRNPSWGGASPVAIASGPTSASAATGVRDDRPVAGPPPAAGSAATGGPSTVTVDGGVLVAVVVGAGVVCNVLVVGLVLGRRRGVPSTAEDQVPPADAPVPPVSGSDLPPSAGGTGASSRTGGGDPPTEDRAGSEETAPPPAPPVRGRPEQNATDPGPAPTLPHGPPAELDPGHLAPRVRESSRVTLVDRRASRRTEIQVAARLVGRTGDLDVLVMDISETGAACSLPSTAGGPRTDRLRFGDVVRLVLTLPVGVVDTTARVQWVSSTGEEVRCGLHFTGLTRETLQVVRRAVGVEP